MLNEAFCCEFRTIQIALSQSISANVEFTWGTDRNVPQMLIQQIYLRIGDGMTNRWEHIDLLRRIDASIGGDDGCLSRDHSY